MNAQTLQAAQAIDAALQATIAAALPRPKPTHLPFQDAWLMNESRRQSPQWLLDQARAILAELNALKGMGASAQDGAYELALPFDDITVRVEYEFDDEAAAELGETAETILLNVFLNGHWVNAELFSDEQRSSWVEQIDAHHAKQNAANRADMAEA